MKNLLMIDDLFQYILIAFWILVGIVVFVALIILLIKLIKVLRNEVSNLFDKNHK